MKWPMATLILSFFVSGCATKEVIREVTVPAQLPTLCVSECPAPEGTPHNNGELAEAWAARGETISCYKARQACVREMTQTIGEKVSTR